LVVVVVVVESRRSMLIWRMCEWEIDEDERRKMMLNHK
jgi:hypothetical protein